MCLPAKRNAKWKRKKKKKSGTRFNQLTKRRTHNCCWIHYTLDLALFRFYTVWRLSVDYYCVLLLSRSFLSAGWWEDLFSFFGCSAKRKENNNNNKKKLTSDEPNSRWHEIPCPTRGKAETTRLPLAHETKREDEIKNSKLKISASFFLCKLWAPKVNNKKNSNKFQSNRRFKGIVWSKRGRTNKQKNQKNQKI